MVPICLTTTTLQAMNYLAGVFYNSFVLVDFCQKPCKDDKQPIFRRSLGGELDYCQELLVALNRLERTYFMSEEGAVLFNSKCLLLVVW